MKFLKASWESNKQFIAFVLIVVLAVGAFELLQRQHEKDLRAENKATADLLYDAALASCERGNTIRQVVYTNTRVLLLSLTNARDAMPQPFHPSTKAIRRELDTLQSAPYVDLQDGTVDCNQAVRRPRPEDS